MSATKAFQEHCRAEGLTTRDADHIVARYYELYREKYGVDLQSLKEDHDWWVAMPAAPQPVRGIDVLDLHFDPKIRKLNAKMRIDTVLAGMALRTRIFMQATEERQRYCHEVMLTIRWQGPVADADRAEGLRKDVHGAIKRDFGKWAADNKALIVSTSNKKVLS